ncbi:MAG: complex I 51 kDa subunit family protein [Sulfobacillus sp.]
MAMHEAVLLRRRRAEQRNLKSYVASGGLTALAKARAIGPEETVRILTDSGLVGRGGAAFPAGRKWESVRTAQDPVRYVVLNTDESEPGTFKDRVMIESDPFMVLEGLLIACYAVSATCAYIYVRGEYGRVADLLQQSLKELQQAGHLEGIEPQGHALRVEIRRGGGAYICGEETALFRSIEGYRGEPMAKPPFPTVAGLFRKPTVVNNVETIANVPDIIAFGAQALRSRGTERSPGTKLFSVSGHVARPDTYEVPFGTPLSELLQMAGGEADLQAVLMGGAAGTFVFPKDFDLALSYEGVAERHTTLGSGAVIAFNRQTNLWQVAERLGRFFAHESCGQCVPCRVGTRRQHEMLETLAAGRGQGDERSLLLRLSQVMTDASICGLGQTAATAVRSLMDAESAGLLAR